MLTMPWSLRFPHILCLGSGRQPYLPADILLFFRGDVGKRRMPIYSRGVRQQVGRTWVKYGLHKAHRLPYRRLFGSRG